MLTAAVARLRFEGHAQSNFTSNAGRPTKVVTFNVKCLTFVAAPESYKPIPQHFCCEANSENISVNDDELNINMTIQNC